MRGVDTAAHDGAFWDGKGLVLRAMGESAEAATAFMQATRLTPSRAWTWEHLAEALILRGGACGHVVGAPVQHQLRGLALACAPHLHGAVDPLVAHARTQLDADLERHPDRPVLA